MLSMAMEYAKNAVTTMGLGFTIFCSVSSDNFFIVIYTFLSLWLLISVTHSWYLKRWNILKKMNSLKKGEGVALLNFAGDPGVPLLNFEGVSGLRVWGSQGPTSQGPGPTFTPCHSKTTKICPNQLADLFRFHFSEHSLKIKKGLELVSRSHLS